MITATKLSPSRVMGFLVFLRSRGCYSTPSRKRLYRTNKSIFLEKEVVYSQYSSNSEMRVCPIDYHISARLWLRADYEYVVHVLLTRCCGCEDVGERRQIQSSRCQRKSYTFQKEIVVCKYHRGEIYER